MSLFRSLLPESIFARKLSPAVEQRLRLAQARADEAIVRTHVENALLFVDALAPDIPFERALEIYIREMSMVEPLATVVVTRALVALGDGLMPAPMARASAVATDAPAPRVERGAVELPVRPQLRLDDAAAARRRPA